MGDRREPHLRLGGASMITFLMDKGNVSTPVVYGCRFVANLQRPNVCNPKYRVAMYVSKEIPVKDFNTLEQAVKHVVASWQQSLIWC